MTPVLSLSIVDGQRTWSDDEVDQLNVRLTSLSLPDDAKWALARLGRAVAATRIQGSEVTVWLVPVEDRLPLDT